MATQPSAKNNSSARLIIGGIVIVLVAALVVVFATTGGKKKPVDPGQHIGKALSKQLRHLVANMFLDEHHKFEALQAAYASCSTFTCFNSKISAFNSSLAHDTQSLSSAPWPNNGPIQSALSTYTRVIVAIESDCRIILSDKTLSGQKKKFNDLLIDKGPVPLATNALFAKADALQIALIQYQ